MDFFNDKSLSKISVHTTYRANSYLSKICLHRINGLVVCSSCEQKSNPPVYAPAPYKETAEDLAMKEMIRKKKEEAPKKIMAEMKQMMVSIKQVSPPEDLKIQSHFIIFVAECHSRQERRF